MGQYFLHERKIVFRRWVEKNILDTQSNVVEGFMFSARWEEGSLGGPERRGASEQS